MNLNDLRAIVRGGESEKVEFKRSTGQRSEAIRTVCGMLNGLGGFVVFGVEDRGTLRGQQVSATTLEDVAAELRRIEPPAFPDIETVELEKDLSALVLRVPGGGGLFTYHGRPYLRIGATTSVMPKAEYERRLIVHLHATRRWENEPAADVTIADLDKEEIQRTLQDAIRLGRLDATTRGDTESILRGLELIKDGQLLNAAVALYGQSDRLRGLYPQLSIRLGRFRGVNRLADFSDNRQYWGNAFDLMRRAESFLKDHVPIPGRVVRGKMQREDHPWYEPRATREATANAICHRDYIMAGGAVTVAMYDDHLEVVNPGALQFGITPEKLAVPHESRPWNPIIANAFYRAGIIERWGSGTLNVIDWCRENGNPAPTWSEEAGSVYVTFLPTPGAKGKGKTGPEPQLESQIQSRLQSQIQSQPESRPESRPESQPESRPESQIQSLASRVLGLLSDGPLGKAEIATRLGQKVGAGQLNKVVRELLEEATVEQTIPDKANSRLQKYRLTEKGRGALAGKGR